MNALTKRLLSAMICLVMIVAMLPVGAFAADNTTVYCQTPDSWTACKAYWWGSTGTNPGWPGVDMTQTEDGIWTYDVPSDATGLIFNNGSGTQTGDLTVPTDDKVMYVFANNYWTTYGKVEVTVDYFVAGSEELCGVAWAPNAPQNKMADEDGDGIYSITYTGVKASNMYEFKITSGSWAESWGKDGGNYPLAVTEDNSTVTINFDSATHQISVTINDTTVEEPSTEPVADGYYVAGETELCGSAWNPADTNNQMSDEDGDGIYTISYENVPAGEHEFKVTKGNWNESWGGDGPGGNYLLKLDAVSNVTISFNTADNSINVDVVALGDPIVTEPTTPVEVNYYVAGSAGLCGSEWDPADINNKMSDADGDGIYTITYENVPAGNYEFKVTDGTWDKSWPGGNYVLTLEAASNVTISFNTADNSVTVGEPAEDAYYVAGESALCGSNWEAADVNNQMSDEDGDGIYTITYQNIAAGDYMFKVTNGTWDESWGGDGTDGNYVFRLYAESNVTVNFNPENGIISLDIEELGEPVDPSLPGETAYYVAGTMNNWGNPDAAYLMKAQEDGTYALTFAITAGPQELKVTDGTWVNSWGADGGNYVFTAATDGEVTVTFNPIDGSVNVTGDCLEEKEPEDPEFITILSMHVAGDVGLTGAEWDTSINQMDCAMGVYSITFTDVAAGTYQFKFVANGDWALNWASGIEIPSGETQTAWFNAMGNSSVVVTEDGSTVTLTFNMTTMDLITGEGATCSVLVEGSEEPVSKDLVLGNNTLTLAAGDRDGDTWTYTATEAGILNFNVAALAVDAGAGTLEPVPDEYMSMVLGRDFGVQINGEAVFEYPATVTVAAGDVVSVLIYSGMGAPAELTLNLALLENNDDAVSLVTDIADLAAGDQIIIAALEYDTAISTTQNNNNRGEAAITKSDSTITFGEDTQIITLVEGTAAGSFGFQVGEGQYLYAASSSSNHLKTTDTLDDNGSWAITFDIITGEAAIVACGENARNTLRYNASSKLFSCYASGQKAVCIYKITGDLPEAPVNKDLVLGDNTLTLVAGDRDGDTWTYTATEAGTLNINVTALAVDTGAGTLEPVPNEYMSMVLGRDFGVQINGEAVFEYPATVTVAAGDVVSVLIYSGMGAPAELTLNLSLEPAAPEGGDVAANLITDIADLKVGDQIIIAALEYDTAISTNQKTNNRATAAITKADGSITFGEDVQIITLVEGTVAGTFGFQVGEGQYLYAASSSSNHLKTSDTLDDNGSWAITFDSTTGEAAIVASGENTRNILRYNASSALFSCYGSGQAAVCIYKLSTSEDEPAGNELVLGDNELTLAAGDLDGDTWTFTATEDGALTLTVTALAYDWMGEGEYEKAPAGEISMGWPRMYDVLINGEKFDIYNEQYAVAAGDVVSIQIYGFMAYATELTLNLTLGEPQEEIPAEPGSMDNPLVIESLPFEITVDGSHDIYYTYVAEQDGTIVITVPEGNLVSGLPNYENDAAGNYYTTVTAGEIISINPWGESAGTYTIAYSGAAAPVTPTLKFESITVSFKDEFLVNMYFSGTNMENVVKVGMITYPTQVSEFSVATADKVYDGIFDKNKGLYRATTDGISAKNMGDDFWLALYAELDDGSYCYTKLVNYSPEMYAYTLLGTADETLDRLLVSMLNYGAAAQLYFGHNTDDLVNKNLTPEQLALVSEYSSDMVASYVTVPAEKQGAFAFTGGYTERYPSVSFKSAFVINYYCLPEHAPEDGMTLYYWDEATYASAEVLTAENASGTLEMTEVAGGKYTGGVKGIPARKLNTTVYVACSYSDGTTTYYSGLMPYSIGEYCGYYAGIEHEFTAMAKATAVYGHYANQYFG